LTDSARLARAALLTGLAFAAIAIGFPLVSNWVIGRFGVRALAATMIAISLACLRPVSSALPSELSFRAVDTAGLFALATAALATGERAFLLLLPAWLYAALARISLASLRGGGSAIERFVRQMHPYAPDFIRPYCRRVTWLWAALFGANAVAIAALALVAPLPWWQAYTGWITWAAFAVITAVEFVVRKAHFRIYDGGPIDSVFERLFPAERTEMGRRASAYKVQMRRSLGMPERRH
jgi:uncharacterized membrane protein